MSASIQACQCDVKLAVIRRVLWACACCHMFRLEVSETGSSACICMCQNYAEASLPASSSESEGRISAKRCTSQLAKRSNKNHPLTFRESGSFVPFLAPESEAWLSVSPAHHCCERRQACGVSDPSIAQLK